MITWGQSTNWMEEVRSLQMHSKDIKKIASSYHKMAK
jgi:hypothetical protein